MDALSAKSKLKLPKSKLADQQSSRKTEDESEIVKIRPNLPKGLKYVIKKIPTHSLRFGTAYNTNFIDDFKSSIGEEGIKLFRQTIFGHFLDMPQCNLQGQIIKCILLLELDQKNKDELHIRHLQGNVIQFSIKEFAIITGLRCTGNPNDFVYPDEQPSRLMSKYFPGVQNGVTKSRFVQRFLIGRWRNNEDAVQMAILYFIHTFVFSQLGDAPISSNEFQMVEDGKYKQFPWGQIAFSKLMKSMRQEFSTAKQLYHLGGMPYALNAWIYECASQVPSEIAVRVGNRIPRILNWRVVAVKPKYETFMSTIFSEFSCSNLIPNKEEMKLLDIHGSQPTNVATTSAAKPKETEHRQISGFEDFSTKPPEELLRRSVPVAETSSPPHPKRMKTDTGKSTIFVEKTKIVKDASPSKKEAKSVVGGKSSDQSDHIDSTVVKAIKKSLKKYIRKPHMTGTSSPIKNDDFVQPFNVVEEQRSPTVLEEHNHPNKVDAHKAHHQSYVQKDTQDAEPYNIPKEMDDVSIHQLESFVAEYSEQDVGTDTLMEAEPSNILQDLPKVSVHRIGSAIGESHQVSVDPDTSKVTVLQEAKTAQKDVIEAAEKNDKLEEPFKHFDKDKIKPDVSDSTTSNSISSETRDVVDALIYELPLPVTPLAAISHD